MDVIHLSTYPEKRAQNHDETVSGKVDVDNSAFHWTSAYLIVK